jgi:hypothetical protein
MPTVFRESGFEFRIYLDDHEPAHVHAVKAGDEASITIGSESSRPIVRANYGLNQKNLRKALLIVSENQTLFLH